MLSEGAQLKHLPEDLSRLSDLQMLNLPRCQDLTRLPESITGLHQLRHLNIFKAGGCTRTLPDHFGSLSSLTQLAVACSKMRNLSDDNGSLTNLQQLNLSGCMLVSLPPSFANLSGLKQITALRCPRSLVEMIAAALTQGGKCNVVWSAGNTRFMSKLKLLFNLSTFLEKVRQPLYVCVKSHAG